MLDVERRKVVEIAEQDRSIVVAAKLAERADADRRVKEADIVAAQHVGRTDVVREQTLDLARLERRRAVEQFEVARGQSLQEAEIAAREEVERARIASERGIDEAKILRDRELRQLEIARETAVENARLESSIEIHRKSREQSAAQAEAEVARAHAVEAEERVKTVRESEAARRRRAVEVLIAEKEADEVRIAAAAEQVRAAVEAEAQRLLNEAENVLTDAARASLFRRRLLERIEGIVRESVKPMEKIEGIRILQVDGLNGGRSAATAADAARPTRRIHSALRYRVQAPMIDQILAEIGIEGGSLSRMPGLIREARDMQGIRKDTAPKKPPEGGGGSSGGGSSD